MLKNLSHVSIFTNDQEKALEFYKKIGFNVHTDAMFGNMRWLTINLPEQPNVELIIMKAESDAEKLLVGKQGGGIPFLTFETSNCQEDFDRLSKEGIVFLHAPKQEDWGIAALFKDFDGNMIYICQSK